VEDRIYYDVDVGRGKCRRTSEGGHKSTVRFSPDALASSGKDPPSLSVKGRDDARANFHRLCCWRTSVIWWSAFLY
jgi:hypothetical protein